MEEQIPISKVKGELVIQTFQEYGEDGWNGQVFANTADQLKNILKPTQLLDLENPELLSVKNLILTGARVELRRLIPEGIPLNPIIFERLLAYISAENNLPEVTEAVTSPDPLPTQLLTYTETNSAPENITTLDWDTIKEITQLLKTQIRMIPANLKEKKDNAKNPEIHPVDELLTLRETNRIFIETLREIIDLKESDLYQLVILTLAIMKSHQTTTLGSLLQEPNTYYSAEYQQLLVQYMRGETKEKGPSIDTENRPQNRRISGPIDYIESECYVRNTSEEKVLEEQRQLVLVALGKNIPRNEIFTKLKTEEFAILLRAIYFFTVSTSVYNERKITNFQQLSSIGSMIGSFERMVELLSQNKNPAEQEQAKDVKSSMEAVMCGYQAKYKELKDRLRLLDQEELNK